MKMFKVDIMTRGYIAAIGKQGPMGSVMLDEETLVKLSKSGVKLNVLETVTDEVVVETPKVEAPKKPEVKKAPPVAPIIEEPVIVPDELAEDIGAGEPATPVNEVPAPAVIPEAPVVEEVATPAEASIATAEVSDESTTTAEAVPTITFTDEEVIAKIYNYANMSKNQKRRAREEQRAKMVEAATALAEASVSAEPIEE